MQNEERPLGVLTTFYLMDAEHFRKSVRYDARTFEQTALRIGPLAWVLSRKGAAERHALPSDYKPRSHCVDKSWAEWSAFSTTLGMQEMMALLCDSVARLNNPWGMEIEWPIATDLLPRLVEWADSFESRQEFESPETNYVARHVDAWVEWLKQNVTGDTQVLLIVSH